jgi:two-component system sensor histidine kinase KdpD
MPTPTFTPGPARTLSRFEFRWPAVLIWCVAWGVLFVSDDVLSLGNLALLLVLVSAISSLWLSALASMCTSAVSVALFNWLFVPPRYTFQVHLHQDLLLLMTMLGVSVVVSFLMARLRAAVDAERRHARASEDLRLFGERLRESADLQQQGQMLLDLLQGHSQGRAALWLPTQVMGAPDAQQQQGLRVCAQEGAALGVGTGRHENQADVFLPLRGRNRTYGAAVLVQLGHQPFYKPALKDYLQQACDMLGLEIERLQAFSQAHQAEQQAQHQGLRNTLLTAISHDYRTPLASLISAASALHDQAPRLSVDKVQALSQTVLDEAQHLHRMTANTLQLARLDSSPLSIHKDWESVQEVLGTVIGKLRQRVPQRRLVVDVPADLPWIHCDALLLVQLLDNLLDNALKYSPDDSTLAVRVVQDATHLHIRVEDEGCGIDDAWKAKVFDVFERGPSGAPRGAGADATQPSQVRRGVGVGLAVCQAIAKVHGAQISVTDNRPRGTVMCVSFPIATQPKVAPEAVE